ncbi:hypothetical protein NT2_04_04580 [Caenibius tardaugens NBRC 16725]|uniref:Lipoprotein n=1 Tax=Caenibius tardaugens NBRC 16725 TaxID=1219035 RepID=U2YKG4_9SPHN|nr:hypothetical protein [Caenibius tardaugens]AZI35908.1 hypothetical protein EGO55_08000 [Caenibius tardaugens NBRC 16725]GAD49045.1 hypothetical protein NT2_04_04580 [Caenibius tardaugens NBRC 16725]
MMRDLLARRRWLALAMAGLLAGCGLIDSGTTYPVSAREAHKVLTAIEPPYFLFGGSAVGGRPQQIDNGKLRWTLRHADSQGAIAFIAAIEDQGAQQAKVTVTVEPGDGPNKEKVAKALEENASIVALYKAAMVEQIDAALEKRSFDFGAIQGQLARATIAAMPQISADMDRAAEASRKRSSENMDRAYREEARGEWQESEALQGVEPTFGEPMDGGAAPY